MPGGPINRVFQNAETPAFLFRRQTMVFFTAEEMQNAACNFAKKLRPGDTILLRGDLGSGKTTWTQGLAKGLGVIEDVTSPTFVILSEYTSGRMPLYHMDAYRLEKPEEAYDLGFDELLCHDGVLVIEWPEQIEPLLPDDYLEILLQRVENGRSLEMRDVGGSSLLSRKDDSL